jgi:hypothetical protein
MRTLFIAAFLISQVPNAAASEIVAEARIVEVDRAGLRELHPGAATSFIMNVSENAGRAFVEGPQSKTLQNFRLTAVDEEPVQFRISSRVGPMDVGVDFEFTAQVSDKREIKVSMTGQTQVSHRKNDTDPLATVFTGEKLRDDITTAEGASILFAGFVSERDAERLEGIEAAKDSPILKSLFNEKGQSAEVVLLLTLHIVRPSAPKDVAPKITAAPPRVTADAPRVTPAPPKVTPAPAGTTIAPSGIVAVPSLQNAYAVQVGAFQKRANAASLSAALGKKYPDVVLLEPGAGQQLYRVRVGRLGSIREVKLLEELLRQEGFTTFVAQLR